LNVDNLARRVIAPVSKWHGWHAFLRGLATNLHSLRVDDKTIQEILRHSSVGPTMNVYVRPVSESQVSATDALSEKLEMCNALGGKEMLEPRPRLELGTCRLRIDCSTN
jgi:integrase